MAGEPSSTQLYRALGVARPARPGLEDLRRRVRAGLPYRSVETVAERFDLRREELSELLAVPQRTLARRKRERRLEPDESDRLFRLARLATRGVGVLGSADKVARWLKAPNRALGGRAPLALCDTDLGVRQVEEILGRIEHGVYS
jgi:putative toxin-antitoxin system antitoxin component (TIGR02293 family)